MSTKNLARTAIEGGRRHYNQWERRASSQHDRVRNKSLLAQLVARGAEDPDELLTRPRKAVHRSFYDKLGPLERWLAAQAGRPFRLVHQELFERFDVRTLAERHVVFDHLLPIARMNRDGTWTVHRRMVFSIDAHGILRARRRNTKAERKPWRDAYAFAQARRARLTPNGYVWVRFDWPSPQFRRVTIDLAPLTAEELKGLIALTPAARAIVLVA